MITKHLRRRGEIPKEQIKDRFVQFGFVIKGEKFNSKMTSYLTDILIYYLKDVFYKAWYPYPKKGKQLRKSNLAPQRHVTMHGEINPAYFTKENCLKFISSVDAILLTSLRRSELSISRQ